MAPTVRLSILLLGLSFFLSCSSPGLEENAGGPAVQGQVAPNFSFNDRSGKRLSLADFRGKVVLINFWATWCPPCRDEMPSMESLQRQMDKNEFAILALSVMISNELNVLLLSQGYKTKILHRDMKG